jgi:hypothetical protein
MNEYWLTTFETEYGDFFEDYLTNKQKRFQTFHLVYLIFFAVY